jgi:hypothetical protein
LWFIWDDEAFHMTSFSDRPHLRRLERNPHAGLCVDVEQVERPDGQRPNQQVRAIGEAELFPDENGVWTRRIRAKYLTNAAVSRVVTEPRTLIRLRPLRIVGVASL